MANAGDRVRFNVGGMMFETTATTLANAGRGSMLGTLLDDDWNLRRPPDGAAAPGGVPEYFIDRNPACFGVLLDLLRTGELHAPPSVSDRLLHREALFYGLLPQVRAARWGPFDGNLLRLSRSVHGLAPGDGIAIRAVPDGGCCVADRILPPRDICPSPSYRTDHDVGCCLSHDSLASGRGTAICAPRCDRTAIRAAPDGGCCVAHGSLAYVYDWTLEEHHPLNLDYQLVNDIGYVDSSHIVLTACQRLDNSLGGMGVFSSSTGELRHRFQVSHDDQFKSFTAGALSFNLADCRIFASCRGGCNEFGIGVWDQITGRQVDFFYEQPGCSLGFANKLQWLNGSKCLMVAILSPRTRNKKYIGLLDLREKRVAWSWSARENVSSFPPYDKLKEECALDAIAMEDERSICVVNRYADLWFLDLRFGYDGVRWGCSRGQLSSGMLQDREVRSLKLAVHGGQLFCSRNDTISVFGGPEWVHTSTIIRKSPNIRKNPVGLICDFSVGGGRLFALHDEENVFDVWETPTPPILQPLATDSTGFFVSNEND